MVSIDSYEDVPTYDEKALKKAVANQPIAVAIEGGGREFQLYSSVSISLHIKIFLPCLLLLVACEISVNI